MVSALPFARACPTGLSGDPVDKTGLADGRIRCLNTLAFWPSGAGAFWGQAMSNKQNEPLVILRRWQVEANTGLSRSTIYRRMRVGTFPLPVQLGVRMVGWRAADIERFLANPTRYRASVPQCPDHAEPTL